MRLVLVPSPFVGPNSWREVARLLPNAIVADYGGVSGPDWYQGAAGRIARQVDFEPWTMSRWMMNWIDGLVTAPSCRMGVPQPSVA